MKPKKNGLNMLKCRLCNKTLKPNEANWIFLQDTNEVTTLGQRLMAILNIEGKELRSISNACCEACTLKAQDCFALLMNVHAANSIIKKVHEKSLKFDYSIHTLINTTLFECDKCNEVLTDMKSYTHHFEIHTLLDIAELCNDVESVEHETGEILEKFEFESFKTGPEDVVIIVNEPNEARNATQEIAQLASASEEPYFNSRRKVYECDICQRQFSSKHNIRRHILGRHLKPRKKKNDENKVSICKFCSSAFPKGKFKAHAIECRSELFSQGPVLCNYCGKSVPASVWTSHLYKHKEEEKGRVTCPVCQKTFRTKKVLNSHILLHDESNFIVCEVCGVKTHPRFMWKHSKKHKEKENVCDICGRAFMFNYMLQTHKKMHESGAANLKHGFLGKGHKCPKCDKEYTYVSMLNIHLREDHNDPGVEIASTFPCEECDKTFDDKFSLKSHLLLMHGAKNEDLVGMRKQSIVLGVFHCPECDKILQSDYGLRKHLKTEHNLKNKDMPSLMKRTCEKCGKTFADKQGLLVHIKAAHLNIADVRCEICGLTFKRYQSYVNHKLHHTGIKPFECEVCFRKFRQRADVLRHLQRHVRDGDVPLDEASARNNSESSKLRKSRVFLKDSKWGQIEEIIGTTKKRSKIVKQIEVPEVECIIELE